jgi:hypothetical protein
MIDASIDIFNEFYKLGLSVENILIFGLLTIEWDE